MALIYKITNSKNEVYIGSTSRRLRERKAEHKYASKKGIKGLIYDSFNLFGFENHLFETICNVEDCDMIELEHFIIQESSPKLNIVSKHNNTAFGKIWVNDKLKEFQIYPNNFNEYKNITKGRLIKKNK